MSRLALIMIGLVCFQSIALAIVPSIERDALVAFYYSTRGPEWTTSTNWLDGDPCENNWYGVTCDESVNITGLVFSDNALKGLIPAELGNLANLQTLYLYNNQLSGSIPPELGNLAKLQHLFLLYNELSGPIPPELGSLSNLQELRLDSNQLTGPISPELGNLTNLQELWLSSNQLTGPVVTHFPLIFPCLPICLPFLP